MNHNFLPFEVTELLPKYNPYCKNFVFCKVQKRRLIKEGVNGLYATLSNKYLGTDLIESENEYELYYENIVFHLDSLNTLYTVTKCSDESIKKLDISAWTILDALTWLEEQGFNLQVYITEYNKQWRWCLNKPNTRSSKSFNSRTEVYIAGITHCLNLIKDETNRTIKTNS